MDKIANMLMIVDFITANIGIALYIVTGLVNAIFKNSTFGKIIRVFSYVYFALCSVLVIINIFFFYFFLIYVGG